MLSLEKSVFAFALVGQRVEADKNLIDHPRMTHDDAAFRQAIEKLSHQRAEIRLPGKIIGAGEAGIECDIGARSAAAELRAQDIENQRLGRAEAPGERLMASALANPGLGRGLLHRRQKRIAYLRK